MSCHDFLDDRQAQPVPHLCGRASLERLNSIELRGWGKSSPIIADRYTPTTEISYDACGAAYMDQRIAYQVCQGAPNRSFDPKHHDTTLRSPLQRELDPGIQRRRAEIRKDVPRQGSEIDGPLFYRVIL